MEKMIAELCSEMDIKLENLSYGWVLQLSKDGKVRHIIRNYFDNNSQASSEIANDKYATYEVLKSQNIPVVEHMLLFNPATRSEYISEKGIWAMIESQFIKYGAFVVKSNNGSQGREVELCFSIKELEIAIQKLFQNHGEIAICPYYNIKTEYRTFYLNGEILLIYGKTRPFVIGDGESNLEELAKKLNLPDKKVVKDNLGILNLSYVPKYGEKVEISWKHNLSGGAIPTVLGKGELYQRIEQLAKEAGKAININFATIDIAQTTEDELLVMEINSGVTGTIFAKSVEGGYEMIKEVYRKALQALFL